MANLIRSAKSGSDWSVNELLAYHITIKPLSPEQFFLSAAESPSLDHLDLALLTAPPGVFDPQLSATTSHYLGYLDLATRAIQQSFIDDFARETLRLLGFGGHNLTLSTGYTIPLTICAETKTAQTDVCLIHRRPSLILLVLTTDKPLSNVTTDVESQVIAEAIAAFQFNNHKRESLGLTPLESVTMPCITMSGTRPTFYLVPVTQDLSIAVVTGQYPAAETEVLKCVTVAGHQREGMKDTEYRKLAFQRFLAFKSLASRHWETILRDIDV